MTTILHQRVAVEDPYDAMDGEDDALIEIVWHELDRQLPRERVSRVVAEVGLGFQNVRVKTFVPIFVHRRALDRLNQELNELVPTDDRLPDEY